MRTSFHRCFFAAFGANCMAAPRFALSCLLPVEFRGLPEGTPLQTTSKRKMCTQLNRSTTAISPR